MKKILFLSLISFFFFSSIQAQIPYTTNKFLYDSLLNLSYGVETDYAGNLTTLVLDIYKPVGDSNCARPVIVLVHGGAWIGGSKEDFNMVAMSRELAKKGWVVANINYRLGTHKAANYSMYALCSNTLSAPCGYIADSSEIFRANFRGMQDAKGAIRFMKSRNVIDSTDINNVFIAGESAGGFISLAAAFTDKLSEKSSSCYSISSAPIPDTDLTTTYSCLPQNNNLSRPDLGSISGGLNLGNYDATIKGVGSFYGAVLDLSVLQQLTDTPCVYLFHQGSDVVVNYQYGKILGRTSWECYAQTNLCQSYFYYPFAFGCESIRQHFAGLGNAAPVFQADIISNFSYLNNCLSNGHSIDNFYIRLQSMVNLFANKISLSNNSTLVNCATQSLGDVNLDSEILFSIQPNPVTYQITIKTNYILTESAYSIYDDLGRLVLSGKLASSITTILLDNLCSGLYLLKVGKSNKQSIKFVKL